MTTDNTTTTAAASVVTPAATHNATSVTLAPATPTATQAVAPVAGVTVKTTPSASQWLNKVKWDDVGLVPVIAQEAGTNEVLMFAWMNRDALAQTVQTGEAIYWSRSRKKLWHKGEESGHTQKVLDMRMDCDADVLLLKIEQVGGIACHTGRHSCFYQQFNVADAEWQIVEPVLQDPQTIYK